jgi:dipeptidyl aminopeptidase/acylaminoacyl peptidase
MERPGFRGDRLPNLGVRDASTGSIRFTTRDWDRSIASFRFSPDGKEVYATADDMGQHPLFAIDISSGARRKLTAAGSVTEFDAAGARVVYALQTLSAPADLYVIDGRGPAHQVTEVNKPRLADLRFGEYEQFSFAGAGGETVYGYAMKPWNYAAGQRYPVAFIVHGGPQSSYANNWSYRWNPEIFAGAGYGVVFIDFPRLAGLRPGVHRLDQPRLGRQAARGPPEGLAAATEKFSWLDGGRACALGGSYGGYMMNWIAGNWPDRFRCLVNHAGLFDHRSMYYTTEELWFPEWDHGGPYYENPEGTRNRTRRTS